MKVYNTLTRQKEELIPLKEGEVGIYACGPTVYNYIHIGNARPICVFDVLRRYLEYIGYKVNFVQNFTDIDDKIINRANDEGTDYLTVSEKYIAEYKTDAGGLNVRPATVHPKATENIDEIISIISKLIEKGYAYEAQGDVYFSTLKFDEYGKLSHQPMEDLLAGARINIGEVKKEAVDFALWKSSKPGEPWWNPLGARADPAGTLNARPCRAVIWAKLSTSIAAVRILCSPTMKTKLHRANAATAFPLHVTGCTTALLPLTTKR